MTAQRDARQRLSSSLPDNYSVQHRSRSRRSTRTVTGVGLVVCVTSGVLLALTFRRMGTVPAGTKLAGRSVGGTALERLSQVATEIERKFNASTVQLFVELPNGTTKSWIATPLQLGLTLDSAATVAKVIQSIESKSTVSRVAAGWGSRSTDDISPVEILDEKIAKQFLFKKVASVIHKDPVNARIIGTGNGLKSIPDSTGLKLDIDGSVMALKHLNFHEAPNTLSVHLPVVVVQPRIAKDKLNGIEDEISRFETRQREIGNRSRNIELACERINGTVLLPGDVFSYNSVVGPREPNYGYRSAKVIVRGKVEEGIGGGICQTSTTLFNAALLAGMKVNRREHHGFPVPYVGVGRDATVVYGAIDFRFVNSLDKPIAILADGRNRKVVIRIFGKMDPSIRYTLETRGYSSSGPSESQISDSNLPLGKKKVVDSGRPRVRVALVRSRYVNGVLEKKETVANSDYPMQPRVVAIGGKKAATPPASSSAITVGATTNSVRP